MDKNSIVSSYAGINAITNVGISLVTVGKKYLSNQNISSESLCYCKLEDSQNTLTEMTYKPFMASHY